jgi:hypothetical protein
MGMLECLRAPSTARGVPAAGDCAPSPSWRGVSLSSSRRNCWLFMVWAERVAHRVAVAAQKSSAKQPAAFDSPDSRAGPATMRGEGGGRRFHNDVSRSELPHLLGTHARRPWLLAGLCADTSRHGLEALLEGAKGAGSRRRSGDGAPSCSIALHTRSSMLTALPK